MNFDDLVQCPYNKAHMIKRSRVQYHLIKCKKNHPNVTLAICPYNASHHIPKEEEKAHLFDCRDRRIVEMQKYNEPLPGHHGCLSNPPFYGSSLIPRLPNEEDGFAGDLSNIPFLDETHTSISSRQRELRAQIEPRWRSKSPRLSRQRHASSTDELEVSMQRLNMAGNEGMKMLERHKGQPLRKPILNDSGSSRIGANVEHPRVSRRISPANSSVVGYGHGFAGSSRRTSPSPIRRSGNYISTMVEGGRLVPRRKSISPSLATSYQSYSRS